MKESDLHNYQKACVKHIMDNPFCGVFLDMGLGKTVSTLTAVDKLLYDTLEVDSILVVAPKRVAESVWQEEAAKWEHLRRLRFSKIIGTPEQRKKAALADADIYIVSRDNVAWLCSLFAGNLPYDMVVVDELSSFKSHSSMRFKALRKVRPRLTRFVGLTGTPAPNSLIDLWPQIYLMDMGRRLGRTITMFRSRFFTPGKTNGHVVYSYVPKRDTQEEIRDLIEDICISMKAEDYLDMPEKTDNFIQLQMSPGLAKQYRDFERDKVLELANGSELDVANAAALSNKLLQFANGAVYGEDGAVHPVHDLKLDALEELVEDAAGQPVLVAWTFRFDRDRIMERLAKYRPRELKTAQDIQDWNNGDVQVLLAHPASAGHGLNLQAGGNIIVWYGQTWSLELYQQFNARLYRQGQRNGVVVNHLVVKGTHDMDVISALRNKDRSQSSLMESIKAKINNYVKG